MVFTPPSIIFTARSFGQSLTTGPFDKRVELTAFVSLPEKRFYWIQIEVSDDRGCALGILKEELER